MTEIADCGYMTMAEPVVEAHVADPAMNLIEDKLLVEVLRGIPSIDNVRQRVMVDVGAYFGDTAKPFLAMGWRVIAIEPDPSKHERLRSTAGEPQLTMLTCAVGDEASSGQTLSFFTSPESPGIASLVPFRDSHTIAAKVEVRTLADVLTEQGVSRVDYLKIDAEGFDYQVLKGFPWSSTPVEHRPLAVLAEFEDAKTERLGITQHDIASFLMNLDYHVYMSEWYPIVRYGVTHRWRRIAQCPCEPMDANAWGNFIAVKPGPIEERMRTLIVAHETKVRTAG